MSNRTAKFVSAVFAGLLAGVPLTTVSHSAVDQTDSCIARPKGVAPPGGHWYYRTDRTTKRRCWFIGEEKKKLSRTASENSSPPTEPVSPQRQAAPQRSIADARAEVLSPQTRTEQETGLTTEQQPPAMDANSVWPESSEPANVPDANNVQEANTERSVVASRWPEPRDVSSSPAPEPAASDSAANVQSNSAPPPVIAAVTLAAADTSSATQTYSIQMLLLVIVGALALAGIIGAAVFRFGSMHQAGRREIRDNRRTIWDLADSDRPSPAAKPKADVSMRRVDIPRELRGADDPNGRIEEMLARLSRTAAS